MRLYTDVLGNAQVSGVGYEQFMCLRSAAPEAVD